MNRPQYHTDDLIAMIRAGDLGRFLTAAQELEPADLADVLAALEEDERLELVRILPPALSGEALIEMPEEAHAEETLAALDPETAADIVEELEDDDAADLLGDLDPIEQERILNAVEDRDDVERLLQYDEESAGGLMTSQVVTVAEQLTLADALAAIRAQAAEIEDFHQVFVVDQDQRLTGLVSFRALVLNAPERIISEVMEEPEVTVRPSEDQEQVARLMARYNIPSLAVTDDAGRLLGRITFDDVTDVVEAETTEDILRFGGVSASEDLGAGWRETVQSRLPWLMLNLVTAFLAASVVYLFESTLMRVISLAVFMPVIAGMGGNAGTQALAVTVRRLALGSIPERQRLGVVAKEVAVGLTNGIAIAAVAAVVAAGTGQSLKFALVILLAMSGNLVVAGFAGAFVPILLHRLGVDPAIASSVFVTTFTDMFGFFLLLGLAGWILV